MSQFRAQDRVLFTVTECNLIQSSFPFMLKTLSRARVKSQIVRARRYWDKYRGLTRKQHRTMKKESRKAGVQPNANVRTERKAKILAATLNRFEKHLAKLEQQAGRKKPRKTKQLPLGARKPTKSRETIRRKKQQPQDANESALETRAARQFQKTRKQAIHGHIRAHGKRRQAKRDSR